MEMRIFIMATDFLEVFGVECRAGTFVAPPLCPRHQHHPHLGYGDGDGGALALPEVKLGVGDLSAATPDKQVMGA